MSRKNPSNFYSIFWLARSVSKAVLDDAGLASSLAHVMSRPIQFILCDLLRKNHHLGKISKCVLFVCLKWSHAVLSVIFGILGKFPIGIGNQQFSIGFFRRRKIQTKNDWKNEIYSLVRNLHTKYACFRLVDFDHFSLATETLTAGHSLV